jgi:sugar lactone lactonase YvrE
LVVATAVALVAAAILWPSPAIASGPPAGTISAFAGGSGFGLATRVPQRPVDVAISGSLIYTVDVEHRVVRRLDTTTGDQQVVAGNGRLYQPGAAEGTPAVDLAFAAPLGVAVGPSGDLFVAEGGYDAWWFHETRVWRIDAATGVAHTYLGGTQGACEPDQRECPAEAVGVMMPRALDFDAAGNLFVVDGQRNRVLRVDAQTHATRTVAGSWGTLGTGQCIETCDLPTLGDGGPATLANLAFPNDVAVDPAGTRLLIADTGHRRIRQVDLLTGIITTVAGNGQSTPFIEGAPARAVALALPTGVARRPGGGFDVTDGRSVRQVDARTGLVRTTVRDAGLGLEAIATSGDSSIVADYSGSQLLQIEGTLAHRIAGTGKCCWGGNEGPALGAMLRGVADVDVDAAGNVFVAEMGTVGPNDAGIIRRIDATTGRIGMFAGTGLRGPSGDGGPATAAGLDLPIAVKAGTTGELYIGDRYSVRRVGADGTITTIAGTGTPDGDRAEGVIATAARVDVRTLAVDPVGRLLIAEQNRIRRVDPDGRIRTIAGADASGFDGDGGPAASARFCFITALELDDQGDLFIADRGNHRIRRMSADGIVSTVAGNGPVCSFLDVASSGDGGPATAAVFEPNGLARANDGTLYISERRTVRVVDVNGTISTLAGNGANEASGDGGPALAAALGNVQAVALDEPRHRLFVLHNVSFVGSSGERLRVIQLAG